MNRCFGNLLYNIYLGFTSDSVVKNPPDNAGDTGDEGLILRSGGSPGGGNGNPLHYSCLENYMDRKAQWATVHGIAESWTQLNNFTSLHFFQPP